MMDSISGIGQEKRQLGTFPHTDIEGQLRSLNNKGMFKQSELDLMLCYCTTMWAIKAEHGKLQEFRGELQSLLSDMQAYDELKVACFDVIREDESDYERAFDFFFSLQATAVKYLSGPDVANTPVAEKALLRSDIRFYISPHDVDRELMISYCNKMWEIKEARGELEEFRRDLHVLLMDMQDYAELKVACFDLLQENESDYGQAFDRFFSLQATAKQYLPPPNNGQYTRKGLDPLSDTAVFMRTARFIFGWQGPFYIEGVDDSSIKNSPHIPVTPWMITYLNGLVSYPEQHPNYDASRKIACGDLTNMFMADAWLNKIGNGQVDLSHYSSSEALAAHFMSLHKYLTTSTHHAKGYSLVQGNKLGNYLQARFDYMRARSQTLFTSSVTTHDHAMGLVLSIQSKMQKSLFSVTFYEPKKVNVIVHWESTDLAQFEHNTIDQCIDGVNGHPSNYFKNADPIVLMIEHDLSSLQSRKSGTPQLKLTDSFCEGLTPTYIHYLLRYGFVKDFKAILPELSQIGKSNPDRLVNLLLATVDGVHGLLLAMAMGHDFVNDILADFGKVAIGLPPANYKSLCNGLIKGIDGMMNFTEDTDTMRKVMYIEYVQTVFQLWAQLKLAF
jgi:hypothetical protein